MQRVWFGVAALALAPLASACGSAAPVDFFDASGGRSNASAGASGSAAGSIAVAGSSAGGASAGSSSAGSGGQITLGPSAPCAPTMQTTGMASGDFQTADAVCVRVTDVVVGWGCSNFEGRTIKVNGTTVTCGQVPLPSQVDGAYYFDISAGDFSYASFYWWSQ